MSLFDDNLIQKESLLESTKSMVVDFINSSMDAIVMQYGFAVNDKEYESYIRDRLWWFLHSDCSYSDGKSLNEYLIENTYYNEFDFKVDFVLYGEIVPYINITFFGYKQSDIEYIESLVVIWREKIKLDLFHEYF